MASRRRNFEGARNANIGQAGKRVFKLLAEACWGESNYPLAFHPTRNDVLLPSKNQIKEAIYS